LFSVSILFSLPSDFVVYEHRCLLSTALVVSIYVN
jgi:hypothetical protein